MLITSISDELNSDHGDHEEEEIIHKNAEENYSNNMQKKSYLLIYQELFKPEITKLLCSIALNRENHIYF